MTNAQKNGFRLRAIVKLTRKNESSLSNINVDFYLKLPSPIKPIELFKIFSQNLEVVKSDCIDGSNGFHSHVVDG